MYALHDAFGVHVQSPHMRSILSYSHSPGFWFIFLFLFFLFFSFSLSSSHPNILTFPLTAPPPWPTSRCVDVPHSQQPQPSVDDVAEVLQSFGLKDDFLLEGMLWPAQPSLELTCPRPFAHALCAPLLHTGTLRRTPPSWYALGQPLTHPTGYGTLGKPITVEANMYAVRQNSPVDIQ